MLQPTGLLDRLVGHDRDFGRFVALIALATMVPMLFIPLSQRVQHDAYSVLSIVGVLSFLGGPGHVSLTAWFYSDPVARPHFREHSIRYVWAPLALIVGATATFALFEDRAPTRWLTLVFSVWLLWHYQRQNWGIHSFVSRVSSGESATTAEQWIFRAAVIGGILGGTKTTGIGGGTFVGSNADMLATIGLGITLALPLAIVGCLITTPSLRTAPLRIAMLLVGSCFFLPVFIFGDLASAFLTYALAHGLQYMVFMGYVAGAAATEQKITGPSFADGDTRPGVATLVIWVGTLGVLLLITGDHAMLKSSRLMPLYGFGLGLTMAHFVIDAGIWRLRDKFPRQYIGAAFPFLQRPSR
ncbi:MAG: hypothetical protein ACI8TX_000111 [Hyphomicrobiaceae bacterium]|jgi:hypothetical protein